MGSGKFSKWTLHLASSIGFGNKVSADSEAKAKAAVVPAEIAK